MKLGISSYTFGWAVGVDNHKPAQPLDEDGLLDRANALNVKLLQIGDNVPLHEFDENRLSRLAKRAAREGIHLEVGARGLTPERAFEYIVIAKRIGATLLRFILDDATYRPDSRAAVSILREIAPRLDGLTLAIENHDRFPAATLRDIVEKAGSGRIGICLDTANSLGSGEGIEAIAAILAPFTVNLHIKDFSIERLPYKMGFNVHGCPAGEGMLNLPVLLKQLASFNRCLSAVLELWTPPEPCLEDTIAKEAAWAAKSLRYLKPLFKN